MHQDPWGNYISNKYQHQHQQTKPFYVRLRQKSYFSYSKSICHLSSAYGNEQFQQNLSIIDIGSKVF